MPGAVVLNGVSENENEMDSFLSEKEKKIWRTPSVEELYINIYKRKQLV